MTDKIRGEVKNPLTVGMLKRALAEVADDVMVCVTDDSGSGEILQASETWYDTTAQKHDDQDERFFLIAHNPD